METFRLSRCMLLRRSSPTVTIAQWLLVKLPDLPVQFHERDVAHFRHSY